MFVSQIFVCCIEMHRKFSWYFLLFIFYYRLYSHCLVGSVQSLTDGKKQMNNISGALLLTMLET